MEMVQVILLRPLTHDWGKKVTGEQVPVTEEVAQEWERRGLARRVYQSKAMPPLENKGMAVVDPATIVERVKANIAKEFKKPVKRRRRTTKK